MSWTGVDGNGGLGCNNGAVGRFRSTDIARFGTDTVDVDVRPTFGEGQRLEPDGEGDLYLELTSPVWDLRIAPLLLSGESRDVPVLVDLFLNALSDSYIPLFMYF